MNQIGSKNVPVLLVSVEKENIPPTSPPTWAIAAKNYLLGTDLRVDWGACVQGWIELKAMLEYGSVARSRVHSYYMFYILMS